MHLPIVRFDDSNADRVPAQRRAAYQAVLRQAIETCRPAGETWTVTTHERHDETVLTFDFGRDAEAPRSFTYLPEDDDAQHSELFSTACQFLRVYWAGERQPS